MDSPASSLPPIDMGDAATPVPTAAPTPPEAQPAKPKIQRRKPIRKTPKKGVEDGIDTREPSKAGTPRVLDSVMGGDHDTSHIGMFDETTSKPRYRSWRKRYRKLRLEFDRAMSEANTLFLAEDHAWDTMDRIKEETDVLLDVFYDLEADNAARPQHQRAWTPLNLDDLERTATYSVPRKADHSILPDDLIDIEDNDRHGGRPPAYLTTDQEMAYITAFDASLDTVPSTDHLPSSLDPIRPSWMSKRDKVPLTEKDFAERHPCSVHNWLRRNRPDLFIEKDKDKDKASEMGGRSPGAEGGGRKSLSKRAQKEADKGLLAVKAEGFEGADEFGDPIDAPLRGKRKRPDDDSYRPKGGGRGRGKRTKAESRDDVAKVRRGRAVVDDDTPAEEEY